MTLWRTLTVVLSFAATSNAYSFLSCVDYDRTQDICYGFMRDYASILPTASHAYNFQANAYNFTNNTVMANNLASQADVAVDPTLQNRTSASAPLPNNQQVYNAYGAYQMLQAAPGQIITLTWPRTADPDGTVADGSSQLNIYYNPNATINAGTNYNSSTDPSLAVFQQHHLANLSYADNLTCLVDDNKYNLSVHCSGQVQIPTNLTDGIYTFLWHWVINNTSPQPVDNATLYLDYRFAFEIQVRTPTYLVCVTEAANAPAAAPSAGTVASAGAAAPAQIVAQGSSLETAAFSG
ncbi:hypothetical protein WJX82_002476 [Trebouxia sp. C0006]